MVERKFYAIFMDAIFDKYNHEIFEKLDEQNSAILWSEISTALQTLQIGTTPFFRRVGTLIQNLALLIIFFKRRASYHFKF